MTDQERWAPIPRHEGYEASTHGRIRSLDRILAYSDGRDRPIQGVILSPSRAGRSGHLKVAPSGITRLVHQLVLEAFVGPCPDGMECCHNDGVPTNNRLTNLRWDTPKSNGEDRVKHGVQYGLSKTDCPRGHRLTQPNLTRSHQKRGNRACKACHRARSMARYSATQGFEVDIQELSDQCYQEILEGRPTHQPASQTHCSRGHVLRPPNVAPTRFQKTGHRQCLACNRAISKNIRSRKSHGIELDVDALADSYYSVIIKETS